jgi:hypothetical protein
MQIMIIGLAVINSSSNNIHISVGSHDGSSSGTDGGGRIDSFHL